MRLVILLIFFTAHIFAQQKVKAPQNDCVVRSHDKVCCDQNTTVEIAIIKSQSEFESRKDYNAIKGAIGSVDFNIFDLIVADAGDLNMTFEFVGTPTSLGTEWQIYKRFVIGCGQDSMTVLLDCSPTPGSSGAFYWKKVSKLNVNKINCGCKAANNISFSISNTNKVSKNENNEYVYYASSSAKPGKILKNKAIKKPEMPKYPSKVEPMNTYTAGVKVKITSKTEGGLGMVTFTSSNGNVKSSLAIEGFPITLTPGEYTVEFSNPGYTTLKIDKLILGWGQIQEINVELGEVAGAKNYEIRSKKPLSDAELKKRIKQLEK